MIKYIGKCLLIESENEKVLAVGDIHIGYGRGGEAADAIVNRGLFEKTMEDFAGIFGIIGRVDKIVLLGDLKHSFLELEKEERYDIVNLFDYLKEKCKEIIVVKGNHDNFLIKIVENLGGVLCDYYSWKEYCFLHGDKDFSSIHDKKVKYWVMGHMHPAIKLREGNKSEKYKCFLSGKFKDKEVIILPSFAEAGEGIDVREIDRELAWKLDLNNFEVRIIGEKLEILNFGKLKKIK